MSNLKHLKCGGRVRNPPLQSHRQPPPDHLPHIGARVVGQFPHRRDRGAFRRDVADQPFPVVQHHHQRIWLHALGDDPPHFQIGVVGHQPQAWNWQALGHMLAHMGVGVADHAEQTAWRQALGDIGADQVIFVIREACSLPKAFTSKHPLLGKNPLLCYLENEATADVWDKLLQACEATGLGAKATDWLAARDGIRKYLERNQSVNLVVNGDGVNSTRLWPF